MRARDAAKEPNKTPLLKQRRQALTPSQLRAHTHAAAREYRRPDYLKK